MRAGSAASNGFHVPRWEPSALLDASRPLITKTWRASSRQPACACPSVPAGQGPPGVRCGCPFPVLSPQSERRESSQMRARDAEDVEGNQEPGHPVSSTDGRGSSLTRRWWSRSLTCCPSRWTRRPSPRRSKTCSPGTGARWKPTAGSCSSSTSSPTWPARSSAWGVSEPAAGSS